MHPPSRYQMALGMLTLNMHRGKLVPVQQRFFDGAEPDFVIDGLHSLTGKIVTYVADWSCPLARMHDMYTLWPLAELGPLVLRIILPFSPTGTMERETSEGVVATANVDAKMLSALPGRVHIVTVDLHTLANQFFFHTHTVSLRTYMDVAMIRIRPVTDRFAVVFPDDGAAKRFMRYFVGEVYVSCSKTRDGDRREIVINSAQDLTGYHGLIVDDLTRTGNTLLECAIALRKRGFSNVSVFVTHAAFPGNEHLKFLQSGVVSHFYTTDSVVGAAAKLVGAQRPDMFTVFQLADIL